VLAVILATAKNSGLKVNNSYRYSAENASIQFFAITIIGQLKNLSLLNSD